jgi:ornithine carbamoyltransferase
MRHFISLLDYSQKELIEILDRADYLADAWKADRMPESLMNKQIGLWFYGNGFRNRLGFEIGAKAMGASVSYIPGELGREEPLEDIGHYLENWYSALVIRAKSHNDYYTYQRIFQFQ